MKIGTRTINMALASLLLSGIAIAAPTTPTQKPTIRDPKEARLELAIYPESLYSRCGSGAATLRHPVALAGPLSPAQQAEAARVAALCDDAAGQIKKGDWAVAANDYHAAVSVDPLYWYYLYPEAECKVALGDIDSAISLYRQAVYPDDGSQVADVSRLMEFALVLNRAGDAEEAVSVYNRAASFLDFGSDPDGKCEPVRLPQFGSETGQEEYTPQGLTAMADLATAVEILHRNRYSGTEPLKAFRAVVALAPRSAAAHFYLGRYLWGESDPGANAELQQAADLGDDQTKAAVKTLRDF